MQLQRASKFFTSSKRLAVHFFFFGGGGGGGRAGLMLHSIGYEKFVRI